MVFILLEVQPKGFFKFKKKYTVVQTIVILKQMQFFTFWNHIQLKSTVTKEAGNSTSADGSRSEIKVTKNFIISYIEYLFSWISNHVNRYQAYLWKNWHNPSSSYPNQSPRAFESEWCHWGKQPLSFHEKTV